MRILSLTLKPIAAVAVLLFASNWPSALADSPSVRVTVLDAGTGQPLPLSIVEAHGPEYRKGITDARGVAEFYDLAPGTYIVVASAKYHNAFIKGHVVVSRIHFVKMTLRLRRVPGSVLNSFVPAQLPLIAVVRPTAKPVVVHENQASEVDAAARLSNSLLYAAGMLPGVGLTQLGGDISASIGGHPAEQTQTSIDGVPVLGPAQNLSLFSGDIFGSASADIVSGSLSFTTRDPSLGWLTRLTAIGASRGASQLTVSEAGTSGRVGTSVTFSRVGQAQALNGMQFLDSSGMDYVHNGLSVGSSLATKLRYPTSSSNVLWLSYDSLNSAVPVLCNVFTGPLPCGYGPYDMNFYAYSMANVKDAFSGSFADGSISLFTSANSNNQEDQSAYDGSNFSFLSRTQASGFNVTAHLHVTDHYSLQLYGQSYRSVSTSRFSANAVGYSFPGVHSTSVSLSGPIIQGRRLSATLGTTFSQQSGYSNSGISLSGNYRITDMDSVEASWKTGSTGKPSAYRSGFAQPSQLTLNCADRQATGLGPTQSGTNLRQSSVQVGWQHSGYKLGTSLTASHVVDQNAPVQGIVAATAFDPGFFGSSFLPDLDAIAQQTCQSIIPYTFSNVFYSVEGIAQRAVYNTAQGALQFDANPRLRTTFSVALTSAHAYGTDATLFNAGSTVIAGKQLPSVPYATLSWSLAAETKARLLLLLSAQYVSRNNPNFLPSYIVANAAAVLPAQHGYFVLSALNVANVHPGPFATTQDAVDLETPIGHYGAVAQPLAPRTFEIAYRAQIGSSPESFEARAPIGASNLVSYDTQGPQNPLEIDRQSPVCGPERLPLTQGLDSALASYVKSVEASRTSGAYPPALDSATFKDLRFIYRRNGDSYAIIIARNRASSHGSIRPYLLDVNSCNTVHSGTLAVAKHMQLYDPTWSERSALSVLMMFSPQEGFYEVPPLIDDPTAHYLPLPAHPPVAPFDINDGPECTNDIRPAALTFLASLKQYAQAFYAGKNDMTVTGFSVMAHPSKAGGSWLQIYDDSDFISVLLPCFNVHAGSADDFRRLGVPPPGAGTLNFIPVLGLYTSQ